MEELREKNKELDRCCQLALRQPLPGEHLGLMIDAIFQAAGYAVLTEDDPNQKYTSTRKTYAATAYGSKTYTPSQNIYLRKKKFSHFSGFRIIWKYFFDCKQTSDYHGRSVTQFLQTKRIPPLLWNTFDFVLKFNVTVADIPGKKNNTADFSSRLEMDPNQRTILKIKRDLPTKPNEVHVESTIIAQHETAFFRYHRRT